MLKVSALSPAAFDIAFNSFPTLSDVPTPTNIKDLDFTSKVLLVNVTFLIS